MDKCSKVYLKKLLIDVLCELKFDSFCNKVEVSIPDFDFGDYATSIALVLGKQLKLNPKDVAVKIIEKIKQLDKENCFDEIYELKGFINFRLSKKVLLSTLSEILKLKDKFGRSSNGENKTVIVEYFQNNVAKLPHVGHLRSAVLGDSLKRIFNFLGYNAISDTHVGDWGTQFGILIYAFKTIGNKKIVEKDPINELNKLYVKISEKIEQKPELKELGKLEFKKLEKGDRENRQLWQWFVDESMKDFERYRCLLGLLPFDYNLGESFYEEQMSDVVKEFEIKGLVSEGETGERYVDLESYGLGRCILIKSDGASTYHLRDFATYIYRKSKFDFFKNIYVVDNRQSHHFKQLFKVLELAGYPARQDGIHVSLGFMSLPEGAISTRKGNIISLQNLVDEAEGRALQIIQEKNPMLEQKTIVASQVARAAIKYFDLSHNRKSEFVFEWNKALSFEGNTGPNLQYTHARINGVLRKAGISSVSLNVDSLSINSYEFAVLRKLQQFGDVLQSILQDYMPNYLCNYLFELSQCFNVFYQSINILREQDKQIRNFRLQLIVATAQVIKNGLHLLGIDAPEKM